MLGAKGGSVSDIPRFAMHAVASFGANAEPEMRSTLRGLSCPTLSALRETMGGRSPVLETKGERTDMAENKIRIIQTGGRFTMQHVKDGKIYILFGDEGGAVVGHQWWLNPLMLDLLKEMRTWKCSDQQIREAYQSLLSGHDTDLEFDVPL